MGFRFGPMRHLFFEHSWTDKECIKLPLFAELFKRSLQIIVIYNNGDQKRPFITSIHLNTELAHSLLNGCQVISSNPLLKKEFRSIIILKPMDSISEFMNDHQSDFKSVGWKLEQKGYQHPRRQFCSEALYICPAQWLIYCVRVRDVYIFGSVSVAMKSCVLGLGWDQILLTFTTSIIFSCWQHVKESWS